MLNLNKVNSYLIQKYQSGGKSNVKQTQAERVYNFLNPADGYWSAPYYIRLPYLNYTNTPVPVRDEKELATPIEEAFFKHYLNLGKDSRLIKSSKARVNADKDKNPKNAEYVGIPQPVARRVQSMVDTLNVGKILRNYDKYIEKYPELPSKSRLEKIYKTGKEVLESGEPKVVNEGLTVKYIERPNKNQRWATGLDLFGNFTIQWDKENNTIKVNDTYDFPSIVTGKYTIPKREKALEIREDIKFNPKIGSYLLRDNMKNYYIDNEDPYFK